MSAFISHSSANAALARRVEQTLAQHGIEAWLDSSDIRVGTMLRAELQQAIGGAQALVLLWSGPAARSRWVAAELLTAYHLGRFVVPCVLDDTPLPFFLDNTLHLRLRARARDWIDPLVRAVGAAPQAANPLPKVLSARSAELDATLRRVAAAQNQLLERIVRRDLSVAREAQRRLDDVVAGVRRLWPLESMVLNLAGYHEKNRYLLEHWDAIQAGRPPKNQLLETAERCFFDALFADPNDYSALNGLGSILILSRDLEAAAYFIRRAIALAALDGVDYAEAKADLATLERAR